MSQAAQLDPFVFPPGSVVQHLTGNVGGIVDPDFGNNIDILGDENITVTGNPLASNLSISVSGTTANAIQIGSATGSLSSLPLGLTGQTIMGDTGTNPTWTASPSFGGSVTALNDITTSTGNFVALSGNISATNKADDANSSNLTFKKNRLDLALTSGDQLGVIRFTGNEGTSYISGAKIDSFSSGTIAAERVAGDLNFYTHPDSVIALPSEPIKRLSISPAGNVVIANPDAGVALTIDNGGETITAGDLTLTSGLISLPTTSSTVGQITINGSSFLHAYGSKNTFVGDSSANFTLTGEENCGYGASSLQSITSGERNSSFGYQSLNAMTDGGGNCALGYKSLLGLTTGGGNTAIGFQTLPGLVTGNNNICLGAGALWNSGGSYVGAESSNILIQNAGVVGESNKIRIGTQGVGSGEQDECYVAGIYDVTPGVAADIKVVVIDSNGQLGNISSGTTGTFLGGNTGAAPTWQTVPSLLWNQVAGSTQAAAVNNGYICQNAAQTTITLPASAAYGSVIEIIGEGALGWTIVHPVAGHYIQYGNLATTANTGSLTSTNRYDTVRLVCRVTDLVWHVTSSTGILSIA